MNFKETYKKIIEDLQKELKVENKMLTPKIEKVTLNIGIGSYIREGNKDFSSLQKDLELITGQKSIVTNAKKSISNFKLRAWMPVGLVVTLRKEKMEVFLEKLIHVVLPRVRDFRGISKKSFDKKGNYTLWIKEHTIFPEVPQNDVVKPVGIGITITTNTDNSEYTKALMAKLGFPFAK